MKIVKSLCWYYLNMCLLNFCYCSNIYFPTINHYLNNVWGIERSGFFNGREKWAKGFENQRV